jgi:hypothetical protein
MTIFSKQAKRGFEKYVSTHWLCAGLARLLAGALRERTKL